MCDNLNFPRKSTTRRPSWLHGIPKLNLFALIYASFGIYRPLFSFFCVHSHRNRCVSSWMKWHRRARTMIRTPDNATNDWINSLHSVHVSRTECVSSGNRNENKIAPHTDTMNLGQSIFHATQLRSFSPKIKMEISILLAYWLRLGSWLFNCQLQRPTPFRIVIFQLPQRSRVYDARMLALITCIMQGTLIANLQCCTIETGSFYTPFSGF